MVMGIDPGHRSRPARLYCSFEDLPDDVRAAIENDHDEIVDLHVWQLGPGHHGAIISISDTDPKPVSAYRERLEELHELTHVTIEVQRKAA